MIINKNDLAVQNKELISENEVLQQQATENEEMLVAANKTTADMQSALDAAKFENETLVAKNDELQQMGIEYADKSTNADIIIADLQT